MKVNELPRDQSRRTFLKISLMASGALLIGVGKGNASDAGNPVGYGELLADPNGILALPRGFSYKIISEEGDEMNARSLPKVEMPAKDRFVPDDRTGGPTLR